MIKTALFFRCLLVLAILISVPLASPAQLVIGQYEDEAPLRTWNTFGLVTAASVGRGDTMLALAEDSSAALSNPALLAGLPKFTLSLNGSYSRSSLYRYAIVNTGVLFSQSNLGIGLFALDFGGISYRLAGWTFALTAALSEVYDRPQAYAESTYGGVSYSSISFTQSGILRTINLAMARSIGRRFQVGIGFNFVQGKLEKNVEDKYLVDEITISQHAEQSFSGFYINGGVLAHITDRLDLAVAFRTSYDRKSESGSSYRYQAFQSGTDILIKGASEDAYHEPWAAGVGARYELSPRFRLLGDLTYFRWSGYRAEYFGENDKRDFSPTFRTGLGGEYDAPVRLFKKDATLPLRLGFCYDRQPMRNPGSAYAIFSLGTGIHWGSIALDIGGQFGRESGSGRGLGVTRLSVSLRVGM